MKLLIKILLGIAIIAGIVYGFQFLRENKEAAPEIEVIRPVRTIKIQGGSDSFTRRYFGTVQGGKRADLSFRVSGTLNDIKVEKGTSVKKGALLAALDPKDFNTSLSQAQASLSQAQAQYNNAQADFKRYENLYKQRAISRSQYDTYKTQLDVTKSAVEIARAGVKSARDALSYTKLTAPFDGVIADRKVENFQDITAKQTIFSLQDLSMLEIVFNIPDNDVLIAPLPGIKSLRDLQSHSDLYTINARLDAMPDRVFKLTLKEVATQSTGSNTYPVTATMPSVQDLRILPGMAATVEIDLKDKKDSQVSENKFSVPVTAILNKDNKNFVWRYENGTAVKIPVNVGTIHNNSFVDVTGDNLKNGDIIITAGVYFLHEGQRVRLSEE